LAADPKGGCGTSPVDPVLPYRAQLGQALKGGGFPTIIAIVDSGVAPNDNRFVFWKKPRSSAADRGSAVFCDSDPIGCNFLTRSGFPGDDLVVLGMRSHGTHVAGLASGRLLPPELVSAIDGRVKLMILKVADAAGNVDSGLVYDAIAYAALNGASVVNLSIAGPPVGAIHDAMMLNKSLLFVIAAGNDRTLIGSDVTSSPIRGYPARYSAELSNVISVAATDAKGARACLSNYGLTVDIAAPGVEVESTVVGGTEKLSGTSQAAPLVSLTAALLLSNGYSRTPDAVKNRIIASADFLPGLKGVVSSESKLNIAKALGFRKDVIELTDSDHTLITGQIDAPSPIFLSGEARPVQWGEIVKIVVNYSDEPGKHSRITIVRNGKLVPLYVDLPLTEITGKDESGKPFRYAIKDLRDIIPSDIN
jgi:subtilisin family serine protease